VGRTTTPAVLAEIRWLFIIDACLTIPIALLGFFCLPSDPQQDTKIWWLSDSVSDSDALMVRAHA